MSRETIVVWLVDSGVIDDEDKALYSYALHCLWLLVAPLIMSIFSGLIFGVVKEAIVMIFPFMMIRKFSGGFHAKKELNCLVGSSILVVICVYLCKGISYDTILNYLVIISAICLMLLSPVDSENRRLESEEKKRYKIITCILATIWVMLYIALVMYEIYNYAVCIAIGLCLSAGLQIPCLWKRNEN